MCGMLQPAVRGWYRFPTLTVFLKAFLNYLYHILSHKLHSIVVIPNVTLTLILTGVEKRLILTGGGHMAPPQVFWPYLPNGFLYHNKNFRQSSPSHYAYFKLFWSKIACIGESQEAAGDTHIQAKILRPQKKSKFQLHPRKKFFL